MKLNRILSRVAVLPAIAGAAFLAASPASAHVSVTPSSTAAGSSSILTFSVPHGCDGSATSKIAIKMPEDIPSVTPTRNPYYDVKTIKEKLDKPITDAHGNKLTERVSQVVYTAKTPLPDGQRDAFELSVTLPDAEGESLAFPTIQSCEQGQTAWTEMAAEGQDGEELESPAPLVTITAPEEGDEHGHSHAASDEGSSEGSDAGSDEGSEDGDGNGNGNGLAVAGLVAGILGLLAGGAALASSRRKS